MSRFDIDSDEAYPAPLWQHWVAQTFAGKRGQAMLRELKAALEAVPTRGLLADEVALYDTGEVCAIGAFATYREMQRDGGTWNATAELFGHTEGAYETAWLGEKYGMSYTMAWEVGRLNDEHCAGMTDGARWQAVYAWVCRQIQPVAEGR